MWKEAYEEGKEEALRDAIRMLSAKGMSPAQIADLLDMPANEVRRLLDGTK